MASFPAKMARGRCGRFSKRRAARYAIDEIVCGLVVLLAVVANHEKAL